MLIIYNIHGNMKFQGLNHDPSINVPVSKVQMTTRLAL
jgi:hypothetical protein